MSTPVQVSLCYLEMGHDVRSFVASWCDPGHAGWGHRGGVAWKYHRTVAKEWIVIEQVIIFIVTSHIPEVRVCCHRQRFGAGVCIEIKNAALLLS